MMRRRDFIAMAGGAAFGLMDAAGTRAQDNVPKVGWLKIQDRADTPGWLDEFRTGLSLLGHTEGRTYVLEERYADGRAARLGSLAEDLARSGAAVIVATSQPATEAARRVVRDIPIVGRMTDDPVRSGFAQSLARPGGNVTGIYSLLEETSAKRLALLREAVPSLRRIGALATLERGSTRHWLAESEAAARQMGVAVHVMNVQERADLARVFAEASAGAVDGLLSFRNPTVVTHARDVVELANRYRMPSIFESREYVELGGFMSYGPNLNAIFRSAAGYVDRILKGTSAADLPIEQPTTFELVINLRTAAALGIVVPQTILLSADETIE
jgi:putative ABC transport system substrate-binding protein